METSRKTFVSDPLKIAIVHSFYSSRNPSGENIVVDQQVSALLRAGHDVQVFEQRTDVREKNPAYPAFAALTAISGLGPSPDMAAFDPDIVHVHNLFPNFGKRWLRRTPYPVVSTLHNYRPLCAAGTFFRNGAVCTKCLDRKTSSPAIVHGCYRNPLASIPVAIGQRFEEDPFLDEPGAVIALSAQMKDLYVQAGVPKDKIQILPHFLPIDLDAGSGSGGDEWIFVGRLSEEKGIRRLLREWPQNRTLLIVGSGPLEAEMRMLARGLDVKFLGRLSRPSLLAAIGRCRGLLFPSECFEGFGLVYMEALAAGTPVLAWNPSVVASFVSADNTGLVVQPGKLTEALTSADHTFPNLRQHVREVFEERYTETAWIDSLHRLYVDTINTHRNQ